MYKPILSGVSNFSTKGFKIFTSDSGWYYFQQLEAWTHINCDTVTVLLKSCMESWRESVWLHICPSWFLTLTSKFPYWLHNSKINAYWVIEFTKAAYSEDLFCPIKPFPKEPPVIHKQPWTNHQNQICQTNSWIFQVFLDMRQASQQTPLASCWSLHNVPKSKWFIKDHPDDPRLQTAMIKFAPFLCMWNSQRLQQKLFLLEPPCRQGTGTINGLKQFFDFSFVCKRGTSGRMAGFILTHSMIQPIEDLSLIIDVILLPALFAWWKHAYKAKKHEKRGLELNLHKLTINVTKKMCLSRLIYASKTNSQNCTHVFKCRNVSGATMISQDMATCLICDLRRV